MGESIKRHTANVQLLHPFRNDVLDWKIRNHRNLAGVLSITACNCRKWGDVCDLTQSFSVQTKTCIACLVSSLHSVGSLQPLMLLIWQAARRVQ